MRPMLQLGHGFFSVESALSYLSKSKTSGLQLQLGHGFFSVESETAPERLAWSVYASIGPRILLRGKRFDGGRVQRSGFCFNWATDSSPWKALTTKLDAHVKETELQLGHGFFSVESRQVICWITSMPNASIGPRILLRGKQSYCNDHADCWAASFNWATDSSPWKEEPPQPPMIAK